MNSAIESLSIVFPVYGDEGTVERVCEKALQVGRAQGCPFEVVIVDDGSPDRSGEIADELANKYPEVIVVHHETNKGYGQAIRSGLAKAQHEWVVLTDGDDQYDLLDLPSLIQVAHRYDLIITFRYKKIYSTTRIFLSWSYNMVLRKLFRTNFRDISTGFRMVHRRVLEAVELESESNTIGAELAIKAMLKGFNVGEVGIQTFPRTFGESSSIQFKHLANSLGEITDLYWKTFR